MALLKTLRHWLETVFPRAPKHFDNSPALIMHIRAILSHVETENVRIVGGVYSTSSHNNQSLVQQTIGWAELMLDSLVGKIDDERLVKRYIELLEQYSENFTTSLYDPDGVAGGTVVDLVSALKKQQAKAPKNCQAFLQKK